MGPPTLTSGSSRSSALWDRPIRIPIAIPATPPRAKARPRRRSVLSAWTGRMPVATRRANVATIVSTRGKSRAGNGPKIANSSHTAATTRKGRAVSPRLRSARRRAGKLERGFRLRQQFLVEGARDVGHRLQPSLAGAVQKILGLIGQVALDGGGDLRLPPHPT